MVRRRFPSPEGEFVSPPREPVPASAVASPGTAFALNVILLLLVWSRRKPSCKGKGCSRRKIKAGSSFLMRWEDHGGRWLNSWGPTAEPRARPPLAVARSAAGGCLRGGFPAADGAAAALSRGQRPPWVLCSGVWVLGRSRSEVVHREDTTRDYQGVLLWDVVLIQSYSCCTRTEGFYLKRDFKKFPKRTWSAPFFASSSQIGRERCSLERSECSPVFLFWLLKCIPVFFFFFLCICSLFSASGSRPERGRHIRPLVHLRFQDTPV